MPFNTWLPVKDPSADAWWKHFWTLHLEIILLICCRFLLFLFLQLKSTEKKDFVWLRFSLLVLECCNFQSNWWCCHKQKIATWFLKAVNILVSASLGFLIQTLVLYLTQIMMAFAYVRFENRLMLSLRYFKAILFSEISVQCLAKGWPSCTVCNWTLVESQIFKITVSFENTYSQNHRIIEYAELEGTWKDHRVQLLAQ